jgi:hypothetical protein
MLCEAITLRATTSAWYVAIIMVGERWHGFAIPGVVERATGSALSRGPGYEYTPAGCAYEVDTVRGYFLDFKAKIGSELTRDRHRLMPVTLAQLALGWWERHIAGDSVALDEFVDLCGLLEAHGQRRGDELRWPVGHAVAKYRLEAGFCSALIQGEAASVFVRAYVATDTERYLDLAYRAVLPLLSDQPTDLVTITATGPIFEETPSMPASHVLNGWISALWGLLDVALVARDIRVRSAYDASAECLRSWLPCYDVGWWSLYSLYPHALQDLAKPFYHRLHVQQLRVMHRLTGASDFGEVADLWESYDRPVRTILAVGQKAVFAVADGGRRRQWFAGHEAGGSADPLP